MSRRNKELISSNFIVRLIFFLIRILTFPLRRPILFICMLGVLIATPMISGQVTNHHDLLAWYQQKSEPITRRFSDFASALVKHTGIKETAGSLKIFKTPPKPSLEEEAAAQEILSVYEERPAPQMVDQAPAKAAEDKKPTNSASVLNAGSIYGYKPIVAAQKNTPEAENNEEYSDLEQPKSIFTGPARALGGDRLMINNQLIRLDGIKIAQGETELKAQAFLKKLIDDQEVECLIFEYTENKIPLGWCFLNDEEINAMLVDQGFALSY